MRSATCECTLCSMHISVDSNRFQLLIYWIKSTVQTHQKNYLAAKMANSYVLNWGNHIGKVMFHAYPRQRLIFLRLLKLWTHLVAAVVILNVCQIFQIGSIGSIVLQESLVLQFPAEALCVTTVLFSLDQEKRTNVYDRRRRSNWKQFTGKLWVERWERRSEKESRSVVVIGCILYNETKWKHYMVCCHIINVQEQSTCNQQYKLY